MFTARVKDTNLILTADGPYFGTFTNHVRDNDGKLIGFANSDGQILICDFCKMPVYEKNGEWVCKHYSHLNEACSRPEKETAWHRLYKVDSNRPPHMLEVPFNNGENIADIVAAGLHVLELQSKGLSKQETHQRLEVAYKAGATFIDRSNEQLLTLNRNPYMMYRAFNTELKVESFDPATKVYRLTWKAPSKNWLNVPVGHLLLDIGEQKLGRGLGTRVDEVILIVRNHPKNWNASHGSCIIEAQVISRNRFIDTFLNDPNWQDFQKSDLLGNVLAFEESSRHKKDYPLLKNFDHKFILGADGPIAKSVGEAYEVRPPQLKLAWWGSRALSSLQGVHLLAQAATGTGKTFAALNAAFKASLVDGAGPVIYSTGTKSLQDQVFRKDIPFLKKALGIPELKVVLMKGRKNYVSLRRLKKHSLTWRSFQAHHKAGLTETAYSNYLDLVSTEAHALKQADNGDFSTRKLPAASIWNEIKSDSYDCLGKKCPEYGNCLYYKSKFKAKDADIIVVNHDLLLIDSMLKSQGKSGVLPKFKHLILDEAHELADIGLDLFTAELNEKTVYVFLKHINLLKDIVKDTRFEKSFEKIKELAVDFAKSFREEFEAIYADFKVNNPQDDDRKFDPFKFKFEKALAFITQLRVKMRKFYADIPLTPGDLLDNRLLFKKIFEEADELHLIFSRMLFVSEDEKVGEKNVSICTVDQNSFSIVNSFLFPEQILNEILFKNLHSAILMSATMPENSDEFGVDPDKKSDELKLDTVFDLYNQVTCYVCSGTPVKAKYRNKGSEKLADFYNIKTQYIIKFVEITQGCTLLACTSHQDVQEYAYRLRKAGYVVLVQGDADIELLIKQYKAKKDEKVILIGANGLWTGMDIKGDALVNVIVPELPFGRPTLLGEARKSALLQTDLIDDYFEDYTLPKAITPFKQVFGRLIRSKQDAGIFVVLDSRITTRRYGKRFLRGIAPTYKGKKTKLHIIEDNTTSKNLLSNLEDLKKQLPLDLIIQEKTKSEIWG